MGSKIAGDLLQALGVTEKYVTAAELKWEIGKPVELSITYFPTDADGNAMLDPGESNAVLKAVKRYKLTEIEGD